LLEVDRLTALVKSILAEPKISLDSFGAYLLSERPFWGVSQ
jgi:hypothetical protein